MLDEAKVIGQSICALQYCSDGFVVPFTVDTGGAYGGVPDMQPVGACSGTLNAIGQGAGTQGISQCMGVAN